MSSGFGFIVVVVGVVACMAAPLRANPDALRRYVTAADANYAVAQRRHGRIGTTEYTELILTSQAWRGLAWKHQLFVLWPASAARDASHALLLIGGGDWDAQLEVPAEEEPLPKAAAFIAAAAEQMGTPVAVLLQVPAQPILGGRREDALIAHTFDRYLDTGDERWPLLLPMVKSTTRAMDAVQAAARERWGLEIATFTVTGGSKRGWTTWLTGAVDRRVTAMAPMVIDMLNIDAHLRHQFEVWGATSEKISDYTEHDLHRRLDTPTGQRLQQIVDPYHYREALSQPKLIICGTNDHYWPLDALNLYWADLTGPKWVLYVPNNGHALKDVVRVLGALHGLHRQASGDSPLPVPRWSFEAGPASTTLRVQSTPTAQRALVWTARSTSRDFRSAVWSSSAMEAGANGFQCRVAHEAKGHIAFFGELMFDEKPLPLFLSTTLRVIEPEGDHPPAPR